VIVLAGNKLSFIIPAKNEAKLIGGIIKEISKLKPFEIIVVDNGSRDNTKEIVKQLGGRVIEYPYPLGRNVPRAIGAYYAKGDILLFIDGDQVISSDKLKPFIQAIEEGADVTLNDFRYVLKQKRRPHCTAVARKGLNLFLNKEEHDIDSYVSIPHAMNRKALETIGWWNLAETGVAIAKTFMSDLKVESPIAINVLRKNARRPGARIRAKTSPFAITHDEILGDHVLGLHCLIRQKGVRGGFLDDRNVEISTVNKEPPIPGKTRYKRSAVIVTTKGRGKSVPSLISRLETAKVNEIVIVTDHTKDSFSEMKKNNKVKVIKISGSEGTYYERFIAVQHVRGENVLFLDGDFLLSTREINCFYKAVEGNTDLALNDKGYLLGHYPMSSKTSIHYCLNILMKKPDLLNFSLTEYPHALSRRVLDHLQPEDLLKPPVAYVKAILSNFTISAPQRIKTCEEDVKCDEIFLGDHLEAINLLIENTHEKGGFSDGKKFEAINELRRKEEENESP
jgi:glycosyltransferase involved in cell wall biosynthesis